ncbi:MAG: RES family NAD+ phosphorylase [Parcubacteria group bacterium]|nr:RES family NAD+ phosphorylase [Parcubacteria group bacterium]
MHNYKDWEDFCSYIVGENRYILNNKYKKLIEEIITLAKKREHFLESGSIFWRARTSKRPRVNNEGKIISDQYTKEEMSFPPKEKAKDGRANPAGISYLYLAETLQTAIAEVKPYIGDRITIASFNLNKKIKVVDIRKDAPSLLEAMVTEDKASFSHVWFGIKMYFSLPVRPEETKNYIPTQYIAELFKNNGYDGIIFDSVQKKDTFNLVLFNPLNAQIIRMEKRTIEEIEYTNDIDRLKKIMDNSSS